jgi:hypothetical protein
VGLDPVADFTPMQLDTSRLAAKTMLFKSVQVSRNCGAILAISSELSGWLAAFIAWTA